MALLLGFDPNGLPPRVADELDNVLAALQTWAGKVDGLNTAERLNELTSGISSLQGVPTGAGFVWYTNTCPAGYLFCDGAAVSRDTYASLFTLWGTTWGMGNGTTTFNVPDLRQRIPIGKAASGTGATLAGTFGSIDHTHTGGSHTHAITSGGAHTHTTPNHVHGISGVANVNLGTTNTLPGSSTQNDGSGTTSSDGAHDHGGATGSGSGTTGSGNPPCLVINYIVKT